MAATEGTLRFRVDVLGGQKTGFFLDQRDNRLGLAPYVRGRRVLDVCCYSGAFALQALAAGAEFALGLDVSAPAIELARANAALNGLEGRCCFEVADCFGRLPEMVRAGERFGAVILDPPSFARRRSQLAPALRAYEQLNAWAMQLLEPGGYLITSCCSHHVEREAFLAALGRAARRARVQARLVELRGQARDHPLLLAAREMAYLKCAVLQVEPRA